jgi:hypothetical protein
MRPARVGTDLGVEPTQARGHLSRPARALHRARRPLGVAGVALGLYAGRFVVQVAQGIRLLGYPRQGRLAGVAGHEGWTDRERVPGRMTSASDDPDPHDQDSEPPTPDGQEPDTERLTRDSEPGSHPDPDPGAGSAA